MWNYFLPRHPVAYDAHIDHLLTHGCKGSDDELVIHVGLQLQNNQQILSETNKNQQKPTETDRNQQKPTETDRNHQKPTETNLNQQKPTKTSRNNCINPLELFALKVQDFW